MNWKEKLIRGLEKNSLLCVGLDTDMDRFPEELRSGNDPQFERNREVIDATHEVAAAYKLNQAFYEVEGKNGMESLKRTADYIASGHPEKLVILDAKKGDIGNTSRAYARAAFDGLGVDAVTVNGYMGRDAIEPFSQWEDKLVFVLCRTSNRSAGEVQSLITQGEPLYLSMAGLIDSWNGRGNLGLVVGATFPDELLRIRERVGYEVPILLPGVGTQGGDLKRVLELGTAHGSSNILINVSRGIMFAFEKDPSVGFPEAAGKAARTYHDSISKIMNELGRW
ncbi:MAG: orotidine-5'-phosphate decarboxylase [Thermoplasmatota archaeon]